MMIPGVTTSSVGGLAGSLAVVAANQNPMTLGISAGRLTIELLTTDDVYARTYDELTTRTIVLSEQANPTLEELDSVKTVVYDPKDTLSDTCLFIPPARNARLFLVSDAQHSSDPRCRIKPKSRKRSSKPPRKPKPSKTSSSSSAQAPTPPGATPCRACARSSTLRRWPCSPIATPFPGIPVTCPM